MKINNTVSSVQVTHKQGIEAKIVVASAVKAVVASTLQLLVTVFSMTSPASAAVNAALGNKQ